MRTVSPRFPLLAVWLAIGCGSTDAGPASPQAETEFHAGVLSGTTSGRVRPAQTTNSAAVTLTGLAGNFTRLSVAGRGEAVTPVYFTAVDSTGIARIWRITTEGTGLQQLTSTGEGDHYPSISNSGRELVFARSGPNPDRQTTTSDLWLWNPEEGEHLLASEHNVIGNPTWFPGDTAVLYSAFFASGLPDQGLIRRNTSTAAAEILTPEATGQTTLANVNGEPSAIFQFGATLQRLIFGSNDTVTYLSGPAVHGAQVSPDGQRMLYWQLDPAGSLLRIAPVDHPDAGRTVTTLNNRIPFVPDARWLRDGSGLVVLADVGIDTAQLFLMDTLGTRLRRLTFMTQGVETFFSVGPASGGAGRILIGENGELGSNASGIIFGQAAGGGITSIVVFSSDRPNSIELKAETGLNANAPVLSYTLRGNSLRSIAYLNQLDGEPVTAEVTGGAVVSFDAESGKVVSVVSF